MSAVPRGRPVPPTDETAEAAGVGRSAGGAGEAAEGVGRFGGGAGVGRFAGGTGAGAGRFGGGVVAAYAGGALDRAAGLRRDPESLRRLFDSDRAEVLPLWRDRCLVVRDVVPRLTGGGRRRLPAGLDEPVFLGLDGDRPVFAVDLSELAEEEALGTVGADRTVDVRRLVQRLDPAEAALLGYARALCHWHRNQRFCGACGSPARPVDGGAARRCGGCGVLHFPRISPAVIMLVELPGPPARCLLARHAGADEDSFSLLAGFLEVGESLEDAVRREVAEEAGIAVDAVRYFASQPWPFPAGLMVGFLATAHDATTTVDGEELLETRWFSRADLRQRRAARGRLGNPDSIDRLLLEAWLDAGLEAGDG
ncbi:NAD(+) diphosphatase [Micromonospora sp. WMMD1102]|uniref:NAD(+) diphosphatase n=1 Tax=Micromonospora sp. WMMD1102 TaxID=3016105 RepID=UPI002414E6D5|nr:NAD(+) diphosphatase [Micromonospora sp. WMMD1102]MDG4785473.1 NAD(+) diphosphatase [Micromonospora sp. WMMD1102]